MVLHYSIIACRTFITQVCTHMHVHTHSTYHGGKDLVLKGAGVLEVIFEKMSFEGARRIREAEH